MSILQTVLNTAVHLGGESYTQDGEDTYQLIPWASDFRITSLNFVRTTGDATLTRIEIWDRLHVAGGAQRLHHVDLSKRQLVNNLMWDCHNYAKARLFLRVVALDGAKPNHCQLVIRGEKL